MRYLFLKADFCICIIIRLDARGVFSNRFASASWAADLCRDPRDYASAPIYTSTAPVGMNLCTGQISVQRTRLSGKNLAIIGHISWLGAKKNRAESHFCVPVQTTFTLCQTFHANWPLC